jgi:hypothetical protein
LVVAAALGRLRAEDERMAGDPEAALSSLAWDRGLQAITQHGLQVFLWHELPRKWLTDRGGKLHIAASLGRLLELVGLARYAAICRGTPDRRGAAGLRGRRPGGLPGVRRAQERSGVELPDLPGPRLWFALGPVMGEREAGAFVSVAAALELAVAGAWRLPGRSWMGGAGWRWWWRPSGSVRGRAAVVRPGGRWSTRCFRGWLAGRCCRSRSRPARRRHWPRCAGC